MADKLRRVTSLSTPPAQLRVLLTGAAGFIGSEIARQLRTRGHEVIGVDALIPAAHQATTLTPEGIERLDVRDEAELTKRLEGVDIVCHQAAMVGLGTNVHDAPDYAAHNVVGTATVLSAMARAGVQRIVQASSMVVYGDGGYRCAEHGQVKPANRVMSDVAAGRYDPRCPACGADLSWVSVDEDAPLYPQNAYAATKLAQEHLALAWAGAIGGRVVSLRYHNVYGPQMPQDTPYAGVASIFKSALAAGRAPQVFEDGAQMRDFVHVADVAAVNVAAIESIDEVVTAGAHLPVNVASGHPHTVLDMAEALAAALSGPVPEVVGGGRPGDVRHIVADPSRAQQLLGVRAQVGFTEGMADFAHAPMRSTT